jgi:pilus assembly protein Flp/PilA
MKKIATFLRDENGAALAEYGLLVALIAVVCVLAVTTLGKNISAALNTAATKIKGS